MSSSPWALPDQGLLILNNGNPVAYFLFPIRDEATSVARSPSRFCSPISPAPRAHLAKSSDILVATNGGKVLLASDGRRPAMPLSL